MEKFDFKPENRHFWGQEEKLIEPYTAIIDNSERKQTARNIAHILDQSEEELLGLLRLHKEVSRKMSEDIKKIAELLIDKKISSNAPWFKKLEDKMFVLKIFIASII